MVLESEGESKSRLCHFRHGMADQRCQEERRDLRGRVERMRAVRASLWYHGQLQGSPEALA